MSSYNQQMVLKTIDTTSQRIKAGDLEVLAWVEYGMRSPRESKLFSDSVSTQFLQFLKGFSADLGIAPLFDNHQDSIIAAAMLLDEPFVKETWGAVDLVEEQSFCLVAVFNNGGLTDAESSQLRAALTRLAGGLILNDLLDWRSWGGYSSIRAEFEKYYHKQLGR